MSFGQTTPDITIVCNLYPAAKHMMEDKTDLFSLFGSHSTPRDIAVRKKWADHELLCVIQACLAAGFLQKLRHGTCQWSWAHQQI